MRGAATFCMTITGLIYAVLLANVAVGVTDPWINTVLHRVVPVFMLLDWWLASRAPVAPRRALRWLAILLAYLAYTLLRGPLAGIGIRTRSSIPRAPAATRASRS